MLDQISLCLVCRTVLPNDAPKSIRSISCPYCSSPNPNPKNIPDGKPAEYLSARLETQTLELHESSVSQFCSILSLTATAILIIYFATRRTPALYLFISSVAVLLPIFSIYFVPAHWEKITKWATSESGDKYQITYTRLGVDWMNYLASYIFQVWSLGLLFTSLIHPGENDDLQAITWTAAVVLGAAGVIIINLVIKIIANTLGKLFPRR